MIIHEIDYEPCLKFCNEIWPGQNIKPYSPMLFPDRLSFLMKRQSDEPIQPTYLGAYIGDELVGVTSYYHIADTVRTRGLVVLPKYNDCEIEHQILYRVIAANRGNFIWDYIDIPLLPVYQKLGFTKASPTIFEDTFKAHLCFVTLDLRTK
jgi:hypothetical protein